MENIKLAVIGLGYVGLPLAFLFMPPMPSVLSIILRYSCLPFTMIALESSSLRKQESSLVKLFLSNTHITLA